MRRVPRISLINGTWPENSGGDTSRVALYAGNCSVRKVVRLTSKATAMCVGFSSRNRFASIEVKPNTAFVGTPVVVEKLSTGRATVVLAETLGSYAAALHAGPDRQAVGIEVSATHHRAVRDGVVTGRATAVHLGSTAATYEIVVEDSMARRVCTARLTCLLIAQRQSS